MNSTAFTAQKRRLELTWALITLVTFVLALIVRGSLQTTEVLPGLRGGDLALGIVALAALVARIPIAHWTRHNAPTSLQRPTDP